MTTAIINGRRVQVPNSASVEELKKAGGIKDGRTLIHRKKTGNYALTNGNVRVEDGDNFVDAPARVKGGFKNGLFE